MAEFDSSDEESGEIDQTPFEISWLDLSGVGSDEKLGISALPGCKFKDTWRSIQNDLKRLQDCGIKDVFTLCTRGEMNKYRVPNLLNEFSAYDITVHHYPFPDGQVPPIDSLVKMVEELRINVMNGKKSVVHCYGGLGRSCIVAVCLLMMMDESLTANDAIEKVRDLRGHSAVQSVKQYNFVQDFRQLLAEYKKDEDNECRSLSR
ncbi:cyclin-dependent kinase inhibitor 3-like isoform X2 [Gigantopelta aegis]|nr:cyclin-dependent kinase inhibitor 3-like isoform X2 [Gigantopelta aegis]